MNPTNLQSGGAAGGFDLLKNAIMLVFTGIISSVLIILLNFDIIRNYDERFMMQYQC